MAQDWIPAPNYMCAAQSTDARALQLVLQERRLPDPALCANRRVYAADDMTGMAQPGVGAGLPGHQCMQAQPQRQRRAVRHKSAFRNMHQATASLYRESGHHRHARPAQDPGPELPLHLSLLETQNMPYRVDAGYAPRRARTRRLYTAINKRARNRSSATAACPTASASGHDRNACGVGGGQCLSCVEQASTAPTMAPANSISSISIPSCAAGRHQQHRQRRAVGRPPSAPPLREGAGFAVLQRLRPERAGSVGDSYEACRP